MFTLLKLVCVAAGLNPFFTQEGQKKLEKPHALTQISPAAYRQLEKKCLDPAHLVPHHSRNELKRNGLLRYGHIPPDVKKCIAEQMIKSKL